MAKTNYQKGAAKEYRIMNYFRAKGFLAFRSAGSHSLIDVVAIDKINKIIFLIQSKLRGKKNYSEAARLKILEEGKTLNGIYDVHFELWD